MAVEPDAQTLELVMSGRRALSGLPREAVRAEGVGRLQRALFETPAVHELAREAGAQLTSASQVPVPPLIRSHLETDGVLWACEMGEAAAAAESIGARLVCLGRAPAAPPVHRPPRWRARLGEVAFWLRARALHPGFDDKSCDAAAVDAANTAFLELAPALHEAHVAAQDEHFATRLRELCDQLNAEGSSEASGGGGRAPPRVVVAVLGARHVPGVAQRLTGYRARARDHR